MVRELHGGTAIVVVVVIVVVVIVVRVHVDVGFDVSIFHVLRALLIGENTNLDTGSRRGAHGTCIVDTPVSIVVVAQLDTASVLGGIEVSVGLHVLNVLALIVTGGGVNIGAHGLDGIVVPTIGLGLVALVTGVAVLLLLLLHELKGGLEIAVHVNDVLSVVVAAGIASRRAEAEHDEPLGLKDGVDAVVLVLVVVILVALFAGELLDELALLELHRVSGEVDLNVTVIRVFEAADGGGSTHELGGVGGLLGGGGHLGGERVGTG